MIDPALLQQAALSKCVCGHVFELHSNPQADPDLPSVLYTDSCTVYDCECKGFVMPKES